MFYTMAERFEHSIDFLIARKDTLTQEYQALLNAPCRDDEALQSIDRQMADIEDTINNLYTIREFCPE